jgi:transcriptional regulator with PAS, ATPase and Fis domain
MPDYKIDDEVYKLIVEQLDGAVVTDKDGRYVYVTKSWEEYFGIKLEEVKGKYVRDVVPTTKIHEALETKRPIIGYPIPLKDRENHQSFCNYIPIVKNNIVVAGFIYIIFNNEKKAVEFANMLNKMTDELHYYQQELRNLRKSKYSIDDIIGESKAVVELRKQIRRAANSTSSVLIEGETGVGKELVAHSIHDLSNRSMKPLIKVNCAAIPSELFESELFGYEYGAFTGAKKEGKQGKFELAKGGSLFLDEINQLSVVAQPKLLRVLQEKEIEKVGGKSSIPIDVRLIVATNTSLEKMIKDKKFRDDLYYRLNVISIKIPALRERKEDIPLLANNIIDKLNFQLGLNVAGIESKVLDKFMEYEWPGNIRELQNIIERGMNIALTGNLSWNHFENYFQNKLSRNYTCNNKMILPLKQAKGEMERDVIIESLKKNNNNKAQSAKELGISRTMLYRKMNQYNIM